MFEFRFVKKSDTTQRRKKTSCLKDGYGVSVEDVSKRGRIEGRHIIGAGV